MHDPLGYEGSHVVVTGSASGMGQATAEILVELGAGVTALDIADTTVEVDTAIEMDLRDKASIEAATARITGPIDSVFSCAGLPGPPFPGIDTLLVNFVGARHLIETLRPQIVEGGAVACISSSGAVGWQNHAEPLLQLMAEPTFDGAKAWFENNEHRWSWSSYVWSKYALDFWVAYRSVDFMKDHGIRLNCTNPGLTDTAMMPDFHETIGKELIDSAVGPIGRYSTAEEQAWPLVMLNSRRMSYVSGEVFWTDGGYFGAIQTGRHGHED